MSLREEGKRSNKTSAVGRLGRQKEVSREFPKQMVQTDTF